jgi:hypothetical protein
MFGAAMIVIFAALAWTLANMVPFFYVFDLLGLMRVDKEEEEMGLDEVFHGGLAYDHDEGIDVDTRETIVELSKRCAPSMCSRPGNPQPWTL